MYNYWKITVKEFQWYGEKYDEEKRTQKCRKHKPKTQETGHACVWLIQNTEPTYMQTTVSKLMLSVGGQTMICLCLQIALLQLRHHSSVCDKMMNMEQLRVLQSSLPKDTAWVSVLNIHSCWRSFVHFVHFLSEFFNYDFLKFLICVSVYQELPLDSFGACRGHHSCQCREWSYKSTALFRFTYF